MGAFDDDDDNIPEVKKTGMKINNNKSMFTSAKKPSAEEFQKKASDANDRTSDYSKRANDLSLKFTKVLEDKTLPVNKNIISLDIEKEILSNLIRLGIDINGDELQPEGMGSISLVSLLFRSVMVQRDRINALEYSASLFEKRIFLLENSAIDSKKDSE